ncbi:MAG: methyltransferase [Planctomycetota bacterium]
MSLFSRVGIRLNKINIKIILSFLIVAALVYLARPQLYYFFSGLGLVVFGEIVRIWATGHLEKNKSLTTSGPYGYVKNPMYVGSFLIMMGFIAMAMNPENAHYILTLLGIELAGFLFYYIPRKRKIEGERLREKFGATYVEFDKLVPDYIPRRLTPYRGTGSDKRWMGRVFNENNELHVGLCVVLGVLAIALKFF